MEKLVMKRSNAILPNRRSSQKSDESQPEEFLVPKIVVYDMKRMKSSTVTKAKKLSEL